MKTKHTKGEWIVTHSGGQVEKQALPVSKDNIICVLETSPLKISPEIEANAKLIAAAPDLLEALMEFDGAVEESKKLASSLVTAWTHAKEAIKKATK